MYRPTSLDKILFHGNGEQPVSRIDVVSSKSKARGYLLDSATPIGQSRFSAVPRKAIVASSATSSSGISFSRGSAHKLTNPIDFVGAIK